MGGLLCVLLTRDDAKPTGSLSRTDVIEIRAAVTRWQVPAWKDIVRTKVRLWPSFVRARMEFKIIEMEEGSIESVRIHPDGTAEEPTHPVTVWYVHGGYLTNACRVEMHKGRWTIVQSPHRFDLF